MTARFYEPAGISAAGDVLYIADTNNDLIRTLCLSTRRVETFAWLNEFRDRAG